MAAPTYGTDLTTIDLAESTTGWNALGGGASGLSASPDIAVQGTNAVDKQITNAEKGQVFDNGSGITFGANDHAYIWIACTTPGLINTYVNRGLAAVTGSSTSAYVQYHLTGSAEFQLDQAFKCWPIRPVNTASGSRPRRTLVGSPSTTYQVFGATMFTTASVKGANLGVDGMRKGSGYFVTAGDGTTPGTFTGCAAVDLTSRYGILQSAGGGFALQGRLVVGQNTSGTPTAAHWDATGASVSFVNTEHALSTFNQIIVDHASTVFNLTNCSFRGLGTVSPGRLVFNNASTVSALTGCSFTNMGITTLRAGVTADACIWVGCGAITANSATVTNSAISGFEGATDSSAMIWATAVDPNGELDGTSFTKGTAATHAIEFGTSAPTTMTLTDMNFSGYSGTGTSATLNFLRTTGSTTVNLVGCTGTITAQVTGSHTVTFVVDPVLTQLTVRDINTNAVIQGARAYLQVSSGSWFEASVTIATSGTTATVTHTAHGLVTGDKVRIRGANEPELNITGTITVTGVNTYTYTIVSIGGSPGTGTITSTLVIIDADTNASGIASDTRSWSGAQPVVGRVRKSTSSPLYKTQPVSGTISASTGLDVTVLMIPDE